MEVEIISKTTDRSSNLYCIIEILNRIFVNNEDIKLYFEDNQSNKHLLIQLILKILILNMKNMN